MNDESCTTRPRSVRSSVDGLVHEMRVTVAWSEGALRNFFAFPGKDVYVRCTHACRVRYEHLISEPVNCVMCLAREAR